MAMPKMLTYRKAKHALNALTHLWDCTDLTDEERGNVEKALNTVRALCDRIPEGDEDDRTSGAHE